MDVEGAGLLAEACHMLCQDCWAFASLTFVGLTDSGDRHPEATEVLSQVCFGGW
jgi:hypothetical protein